MLCFWSKIAGPAAGWGKARLGFQGESFRRMGNNQGRGKVSAQRGEPGRGRPRCVRGPSAGGQQWLVLPAECSPLWLWEGLAQRPLFVLACSPNCLQTPRPCAFAHAVPEPPSRSLHWSCDTVRSLQGVKVKVFVIVSKSPFSCSFGLLPGKAEVLVPTRCPALRGAQSP